MQVVIDIPDFAPISLNKNIKELSESIKLNAALMFYKNAKFSIEQASNFANLDIYDFIKECKKNKISIIEIDKTELENELSSMKAL